MAEGDAFNRVLLDRAKRRLEALGFFEKVAISTEQGTEPDRVVLNVEVVEKGTGSLSLGGGYSTADGFIADVALTEANFMGRGQYLKVAVSGGASQQSYTLSFTEPYFLGRRMAAGFDLYKQSYEDSDNRDYDYERIGGTLRFGLPITNEISFNPFYTFERKELSNYDLYGKAKCLTGRYRSCRRGALPSSRPWATRWSITRLTTCSCRPMASTPSSSRNLPVSAETSSSSVRPSMPATIMSSIRLGVWLA